MNVVVPVSAKTDSRTQSKIEERRFGLEMAKIFWCKSFQKFVGGAGSIPLNHRNVMWRVTKENVCLWSGKNNRKVYLGTRTVEKSSNLQ